jgi:adenylate cyclase
MLAKLLTNIIGSSRVFSLEQRIHNTISIVIGVLSFPMLILLTFLDLRLLHILSILFCGFVNLAFYYLSRFRRRTFALVPLLVLLITLSIIWIYGYGLNGFVHLFLLGLAVPTAILLRGIQRTLGLLLIVATVLSLTLYDINHSDQFLVFDTPSQKYVDFGVNFVMLFVILSLVTTTVLNSLDEERSKSDGLLLNILPAQIAFELKEYGSSKPKRYDSVTVVFSDFVGFSRTCQNLSAEEILQELDVCFSAFDNVTERYSLHRLKTIGDSYMLVGGMPAENANHPASCTHAALEMAEFVHARKAHFDSLAKPYWDIRVGVHTGPVVAGVIGKQKFAYDIWGETVNMASRMESHSLPGRVNISHATYEQVRDKFNCEFRGVQEIKKLDSVQMYFANKLA